MLLSLSVQSVTGKSTGALTGQKPRQRISHHHRPTACVCNQWPGALVCLPGLLRHPFLVWGVKELMFLENFMTEMKRGHHHPPHTHNRLFQRPAFPKGPEMFWGRSKPWAYLWVAACFKRAFLGLTPFLPWLTTPAAPTSPGLSLLRRLACVSFCLKLLLNRMQLLRLCNRMCHPKSGTWEALPSLKTTLWTLKQYCYPWVHLSTKKKGSWAIQTDFPSTESLSE